MLFDPRVLIHPNGWELLLPSGNRGPFLDAAGLAVTNLRESKNKSGNGKYSTEADQEYIDAYNARASGGKGYFPKLKTAKQDYKVFDATKNEVGSNQEGAKPKLPKTMYHEHVGEFFDDAIFRFDRKEWSNKFLAASLIVRESRFDINRDAVLAIFPADDDYNDPPPQQQQQLVDIRSIRGDRETGRELWRRPPVAHGTDAFQQLSTRILENASHYGVPIVLAQNYDARTNTRDKITNIKHEYAPQDQSRMESIEQDLQQCQEKVTDVEIKQENMERKVNTLTESTQKPNGGRRAQSQESLDNLAHLSKRIVFTTPGKPQTMPPISESTIDENNSPSTRSSPSSGRSVAAGPDSPFANDDQEFRPIPPLAPEEADVVDEGSPRPLDAAAVARRPPPGADDDDSSTSSEKSAPKGIIGWIRKKMAPKSSKQESPENDMKPAAKKTPAKPVKHSKWNDIFGNAAIYDSDSSKARSPSDSSQARSPSVASPSVPRVGVDVEVVSPTVASPTVASPTVARVETVVSSPESVASEVSILAGGDAVEVVDGVLETLQEEATVEEVQSPARAAAALAALAFQPQPQPPLCHPIAARTGRPCKRCKPPIYCNNHRADAEEQNRLNAPQNNHNEESDDEEENEEEEE